MSSQSPAGSPMHKSSLTSDKAVEVNANVSVVCRVRPFNPREMELHEQAIEGKPAWEQVPLRSVVEFDDKQCSFMEPIKGDEDGMWREKERFQFDECLWSIPSEYQDMPNNPFASQKMLYDQCGVPLLAQAWKGFNTCFFAYGQTGAGKTYSMMGENVDPGLIPRVCQRLFEQIEEAAQEAEAHKEQYVASFKVEVRYMEIYNEMVKDLLWNLSPLTAEQKAKINHENLRIRSSPATGVFVENLIPVETDSWKRMVELIKLGNENRSTAATKMNERSSRSHALFKITFSQVTTLIPKKQFEKPTEHIRDSAINLVDLAGSERNKKTGATGDRLKEAASINKSLTCLKNVIDALVEKRKRIPYRDSHLTSLLADSLGGNAKTFMLICVSPHTDNAEETLQTLKYGSKARQIVNIARVNENAAGRMMLALEDELEKMKGELDRASSADKVEDLKAQIAEHEASIQHLEKEREAQQEKLVELRERKEKEVRQRQLVAYQRLHALTRARTRTEEAATEQRKLKRRLSTLRKDKAELDRQHDTTEREQDALRDLIEEHRQRTAEVEAETEQWRKKQAKLEAHRREQLKTLQELQYELTRLRESRVASLLRARLATARVRVHHRKRLKEQQAAHEEQIRVMTAQSERTQEKLNEDFAQQRAELQDENEVLEAEHKRLEAELARIEHDKLSQISKLEQEVSQLQAENRRKKEQNIARIRIATQDWERKHKDMVSHKEEEYNELCKTLNEKHRIAVEAEQHKIDAAEAEWDAELGALKKKWDDEIQRVVAEGETRRTEAEEEWAKKHDAKLAENMEMRERLLQIQQKEDAYRLLHLRYNSLVASSSIPKAQSAPLRRLLEQLQSFSDVYDVNQPSRYKLEQLIGDGKSLAYTRCKEVPIVSATEDAIVADELVESKEEETQRKLKIMRSRSPTLRSGGIAQAKAATSAAASPSSPGTPKRLPPRKNQ